MEYLLWAITLGAVTLLFLTWDKKSKEIEKLKSQLDEALSNLAGEQKRQAQSRSESDSSKKELKDLREKDQGQRQKLHSLREELKKLKQDLADRERELKDRPKSLVAEPEPDERPVSVPAPASDEVSPAAPDNSAEIELLHAKIAELEEKATMRFKEYEQKYAEKLESTGARELEKVQAKLAKLEGRIDDYKQKALAAEKEKRAALRKAESNQTVFMVTKSQLEATQERLRMLEDKVRDALKAPATSQEAPLDSAPSPTKSPAMEASATASGADNAKTSGRKPKKASTPKDPASQADSPPAAETPSATESDSSSSSTNEADANA